MFGITATDYFKSDLSDLLCKPEVMIALVHQHLPCTCVRMTTQANKHQSEWQFAVRDMVYLELKPYIQSSLVP